MFIRRPLALVLSLLLATAPLQDAFASQGSLVMPTVGTVSGLTLVNDINAALDALATCNSGGSQPLNSSAAPSIGQFWCDNGTAGYLKLTQYDGTSWQEIGRQDTTNHLWVPPVGGGAAVSLASGSTVDLGSVPQSYVTITGNTTITSFGSSARPGTIHFFKFSGALTLTNSGSLILPANSGNITTAAGDTGAAIYVGSSNWVVLYYTSANGTALNQSSNFVGAINVNSPISPTSLSTSQNNYNPTGLSTANTIRLSSSANVNITGILAPVTNGQRLTLQNINAASGSIVTLTANDSNSTAANRFLFPRPVALLPNQSISIVYDSASAGWRLENEIRVQPVAGGFKNLRVFNVATAMGDSPPATPNHQMTIKADELTVEDVNGGAYRLSTVSCSPDVTTGGAGGLDTGSVSTATWYSEWVIFNPSTNTTNCMFSASSTLSTITLPSGYTFGARVGWNYYLTNFSVTGFERVIQYGNRAHFVPTASSPTQNQLQIANGIFGSNCNGVTPSWATVSVTPVVPPTASSIFINHTNGASGGTTLVAPGSNYAGSGASNSAASSTGASTTNWTIELVLEGASLAVCSGVSTFIVFADGWRDNL